MRLIRIPQILFFCTFSSFAGAALSGGVTGNGTNVSAIPLDYKSLQVDFGGVYSPGGQLGLKKANGKAAAVDGAERYDASSAINYGLFPFLETGLFFPYYKDLASGGEEFKGLGDVRASLKLNYPPYPHKKGFEVSLLAQLDLPTATTAGEVGGYTRHAWYTTTGSDTARNAFGAKGPTLSTRMLTTANFGAIEGVVPILLHLNWGAAFAGSSSQNAFLLGGGAEVSPYPAVTLFWSFNSEVSISQAAKRIPIFEYPYASSAGLQFNIPKAHLQIYGGMDFVIHDFKDTLYAPPSEASASQPRFSRFPLRGWFAGLTTQFSFLPKDVDGDGIFEDKDKCPNDPEDFDGFEDDDGCPDLDNDKDGIPDALDKCPNVAEDIDGFEDEDGCPDLDNDKDGIPDALDKCPNDAEDMDGFEDTDGCPDPDNDKDGVCDPWVGEKGLYGKYSNVCRGVDKCISKPEDFDGFEDDDGCPDPDNDKDGILDSVDKCPNVPEDVNGFEDSDGCPDGGVARVTPPQAVIPPASVAPKTGVISSGITPSAQ